MAIIDQIKKLPPGTVIVKTSKTWFVWGTLEPYALGQFEEGVELVATEDFGTSLGRFLELQRAKEKE